MYCSFFVSFRLHDLSAILASEEHWEARLLFLASAWSQEGLAGAELRVLRDGMCPALDAGESATLPPHFVAAATFPIRLNRPFTIPAIRLCQLFKFLTSRMPQNASIASGAYNIVCLQNKMMLCHLWVRSIQKTFDQLGLGLGLRRSSTSEFDRGFTWTVFFMDVLQNLNFEVLGDAFVAPLALEPSRPWQPLMLLGALRVSNLQKELVLSGFGFLPILFAGVFGLMEVVVFCLQQMANPLDCKHGNTAIPVISEP